MDTLLNLLREIQATPIDQREARFADRSLVGRAGQRLYRADEPVDEIYILVTGYARAYVGERGNGRTTLLMCGPAILGDREVLAGSTARDSVRLLTAGHLISIPREDFLNEWFASPELRAWITRDLVGRYASSLSWFALETSSLADRLSGLLRVLSSLGLPVRALAAVLGVSERSVFRALAELRARPQEDKEDKEETELMYSLIAEPTSVANSENQWNESTDEFEESTASRIAG